EFLEATYDLYLSALVELGLVLLMVSVVVNSLARLLILRMVRQAAGKRRTPARSWLTFWRKPSAVVAGEASEPAPDLLKLRRQSRKNYWVNQIMTFVLGMCLAVTVGCLALILAYLIYQGVGALDWNFFTQLPAPVGEVGGGMANALYGSFVLVGLA